MPTWGRHGASRVRRTGLHQGFRDLEQNAVSPRRCSLSVWIQTSETRRASPTSRTNRERVEIVEDSGGLMLDLKMFWYGSGLELTGIHVDNEGDLDGIGWPIDAFRLREPEGI